MIHRLLLVVLTLLVLTPAAHALPRFAARTGAECRLCHVSPAGGGMRTRYGSAVFQRLALPLEIGAAATEDDGWGFSPRLTEWLTVGADLRTAYLFSAAHGERPVGEPAQFVSSFFLMQADLYTAATLGRHTTVVLDVGVYTGFEAWLLLRAAPQPSTFDAYVRIGRFMPAFGVRDANHDLYARAGIGLGPNDRDSGLEVTGVAGPLTLSVALVNGTFGDAVLDGRGSEQRSFEKALVSRASVRFGLGRLHVQLGASAYLNDNLDQANPLFRAALGPQFDVRSGVDELRVGGHLQVGLGPLAYVGELIYVGDRFQAAPVGDLHGYASAQELSLQVIQGVEALLSYELSEPDVELAGNATMRFGVAVEVFVGPFLELRAMARHALSDAAPTGDVTDALLFAHAAW